MLPKKQAITWRTDSHNPVCAIILKQFLIEKEHYAHAFRRSAHGAGPSAFEEKPPLGNRPAAGCLRVVCHLAVAGETVRLAGVRQGVCRSGDGGGAGRLVCRNRIVQTAYGAAHSAYGDIAAQSRTDCRRAGTVYRKQFPAGQTDSLARLSGTARR